MYKEQCSRLRIVKILQLQSTQTILPCSPIYRNRRNLMQKLRILVSFQTYKDKSYILPKKLLTNRYKISIKTKSIFNRLNCS